MFMSKIQALAETEIQNRMKNHASWRRIGAQGAAIERTWELPSFKAAIAFVGAIAVEADRMDHHPDILVKYNKVTLTLSTHDANGLSARDFLFAEFCDKLVPPL